MNERLLTAEHIEKRFGATVALQDASLEVTSGQVHALLGENGAGKSTMMKILAGYYKPDRGMLTIDDRHLADLSHWSTRAATRAGVVAVYQELSLSSHLTVAENLFLGVETTTLKLAQGLISPRDRAKRARELLLSCDLSDIEPNAIVGELSLATQQMVEVVKALTRHPRVLLLDEATSSLPEDYVQKLFRIVQRLKEAGVAILFVSHRLDEIDHFADQATIFRDGINVGTMDAPFDRQTLIDLMAGRAVQHRATSIAPTVNYDSAPLISAHKLILKESHDPITIDIWGGEVVGVAGLEGHGQQEFLLSLFGAYHPVGGTIRVLGSVVRHPEPRRMISRGVVLVPQNRKTEALHLNLSIQENVALMGLPGMARAGWIDSRKEREHVTELVDRLAVRRTRLDDPASSLSGGNQQKLVFAKVLLTKPRVLLLVDPMRGVDVATKTALFDIIRDLAKAGTAIVLYSSDTSELVGVATRVLVFYEYHVVTTLVGSHITNETLVDAAFHRKEKAIRAHVSVAQE